MCLKLFVVTKPIIFLNVTWMFVQNTYKVKQTKQYKEFKSKVCEMKEVVILLFTTSCNFYYGRHKI